MRDLADGQVAAWYHVDRVMEQEGDQFVVLHGVTWADYERLLEIRGEKSVPRLTYLEGELELMTPSLDHDSIKSIIGHLVERYCTDRDIEIRATGAWTVKKRKKQRGAEADESYVFGTHAGRPKRPDLSIEVVWTSGGIDKLEVYRKLGVPEVWVWEAGAIRIFRLRGETYQRFKRSKFLPDLDVNLLARFVDRPTINQALRDFLKALAEQAT